jgi:hypothetical protein
MPTHGTCAIDWQLVDDLPGEHVYIQHCPNCKKDYGPEFKRRHWSQGGGGDPVPRVTPGLCPRARLAA